MIYLPSVLIGAYIGVIIGFIIGKIRSTKIINQLKAENERLYRDYSRVSTRGPGGRFIKPKD